MTWTGFADQALGRLSWDALPFWSMIQNPTTSSIVNGIIATGAASVVVIGAIVVAGLIT